MSETTEIIRKYGIQAKKRLSQNFLTDAHVVSKIVAAAELDDNTHIIEIGSGFGALTKELLMCAASVTAIELDSRLCEILENEYGCEKLSVINQDIMKTDITALAARERENGRVVKVLGNLPYHLTTPVLMRLLEETKGLKSLILMMQKEVAERVLSAPGSKNYGSLTVAVNYNADARLIASVPPNCFIPRPGVHSSVVLFDILGEKSVKPADEAVFRSVIRAAFGQRRKTLYNALQNQLLPQIGMSREQLMECFVELENAGIPPSIRGEKLSLEEFSCVSDVISKKTCSRKVICSTQGTKNNKSVYFQKQ